MHIPNPNSVYHRWEGTLLFYGCFEDNIAHTAALFLYPVSTLQQSGPTEQLCNIIQHLDRSLFEPHLRILFKDLANNLWKAYQEQGGCAP